jgi:RNA polymerase sigma factor (sigma-70 family)
MDRALINSIREGDELVFRQAYDLFHEKLYAYFLLKTKSDDISEELVQLTFIKLWRYRHKLNAELPLSWQLFRIAKTSLIDILRSHAANRTVSFQVIEQTDIPEDVPLYPADDHKLTAMMDSLAHLSPMRRRIIGFRLEGLSNKEIADCLSISKKTVENQINRAVREIRKMNEYISLFVLLILWC